MGYVSIISGLPNNNADLSLANLTLKNAEADLGKSNCSFADKFPAKSKNETKSLCTAVEVAEVSCSLKRIEYEARTTKRVEKSGGSLTGKRLGFSLEQTSPVKYQRETLMCQVAGHGSLKNRAEKRDGMEHDHIPSIAAIKKFAECTLKRRLRLDEYQLLYDRATVVALPDAVHAKSRTYKWRNTKPQITEDAKDLYQAACRDIEYLKENLRQHGVSQDQIDECVSLIHQRNVALGLYSIPVKEEINVSSLVVSEQETIVDDEEELYLYVAGILSEEKQDFDQPLALTLHCESLSAEEKFGPPLSFSLTLDSASLEVDPMPEELSSIIVDPLPLEALKNLKEHLAVEIVSTPQKELSLLEDQTSIIMMG